MRGSFSRGAGPPVYSVDLDALPHDSVGAAVVSVVAAYTGTDVEDLAPLTESIDPDILESLRQASGKGTSSRTSAVLFEYQGLVMSVSSDGELQLRPVDHFRTDEPDQEHPPSEERDP